MHSYSCWCYDMEILFTLLALCEGNPLAFLITGPLYGESISHRWISLTKANDMKLEQPVEQTVNLLVTWYAMALMWRHCDDYCNGPQLYDSLVTTWSNRVDSSFAPCQWETALLCNDVSHWLGASLESTLVQYNMISYIIAPLWQM